MGPPRAALNDASGGQGHSSGPQNCKSDDDDDDDKVVVTTTTMITKC